MIIINIIIFMINTIKMMIYNFFLRYKYFQLIFFFFFFKKKLFKKWHILNFNKFKKDKKFTNKTKKYII